MDATDEPEIRQLLDDYLRMYASRDDRLTAHFSDNFSGFTGGGDFLVKDREAWVAITRQDFAQVKEPIRIALKDVAIQSLADTVAVATSFFSIHLPIKDHVLSRETARLVLIFHKESAGWKIAHSSISIPYHLVRKGEVYPLEELVDRNRYLEELVAERTAQLSAANDNLRQINVELAREIAERKQAEADKEKLEALNRQLQKTESLGRMAGAIAHHFNNQLQSVMGNLEVAMHELPGKTGPAENLADAMESVRKAAEVSSLMLTYLGQTPCQLAPLYLCEACRQSLAMLRAVMPKDVVLETDLPTPGPAVRANVNQIQQVLANLLTNAWEASSGETGATRLTITTAPAAAISATHRFPIDFQPENQAYACLEVADDGCGIADKDIENIFDPFFSRKFAGRGLGLAVVLGIARTHHGAITVESQPGRGSSFRVFLPVTTEAVPQKPVPEAPSAARAKGGTVLVVDDEPAVRKATRLALQRLGFEVMEAADGIEALAIFGQHQAGIRCVLCDLTMPRMDGWRTLAALRKLVPGLPVILASGYHEAQVMAGAQNDLPDAFLSKPYTLKALEEALIRVLAPKPAQ